MNNYPAEQFCDEFVRWRRSINGKPKTVRSRDANVVAVVDRIRERQESLACLALNMPYGIHEMLDRPVAYFTLLRDPVSRCVSYWFFAYEHRDEHPLWSELAAANFEFSRIIDEGIAYQFSNDQTRMITGSDAITPGEPEFRLAQELIREQYFHVGTVDQFDESLRVLAEGFGWKRISYERLLVGQKTEESILPRDALKIFRDANEWDIRLYEWVIKQILQGGMERAAPRNGLVPARDNGPRDATVD